MIFLKLFNVSDVFIWNIIHKTIKVDYFTCFVYSVFYYTTKFYWEGYACSNRFGYRSAESNLNIVQTGAQKTTSETQGA